MVLRNGRCRSLADGPDHPGPAGKDLTPGKAVEERQPKGDDEGGERAVEKAKGEDK